MRSTDAFGKEHASAGPTWYSTLSRRMALAICCALASEAYTRAKRAESATAAWPLPQPQSHARPWSRTISESSSKSAAGYTARALTYRSALSEKRSMNVDTEPPDSSRAVAARRQLVYGFQIFGGHLGLLETRSIARDTSAGAE